MYHNIVCYCLLSYRYLLIIGGYCGFTFGDHIFNSYRGTANGELFTHKAVGILVGVVDFREELFHVDQLDGVRRHNRRAFEYLPQNSFRDKSIYETNYNLQTPYKLYVPKRSTTVPVVVEVVALKTVFRSRDQTTVVFYLIATHATFPTIDRL